MSHVELAAAVSQSSGFLAGWIQVLRLAWNPLDAKKVETEEDVRWESLCGQCVDSSVWAVVCGQ